MENQDQEVVDDAIDAESAIETTPSKAPAGIYMENYRALADAARELREQDNVDIDRLIPLVDKALGAYAACKERIEAVERLLAERLGQSDKDEQVAT